jgi:hypothetical protein
MKEQECGSTVVKNGARGWVWWHMSATSALGRWKQEDPEFKATKTV